MGTPGCSMASGKLPAVKCGGRHLSPGSLVWGQLWQLGTKNQNTKLNMRVGGWLSL